MVKEVKGLVLRTTDIKECDRLITVYTEEEGIVTALAKSARSYKSRKMSSTMQFCYGSFVLYGQGDKLFVKEASLIESFFDIRHTIDGLALAGYVVEVLEHVATSEADRDLLRLCLNTLYAISTAKYDFNLVKAAFEIRIASLLGFMPNISSCEHCGRSDGDFFFDIMAGAVRCKECHDRLRGIDDFVSEDHESHIISILTEGAKFALEYSIYSPLERIFSFNLAEEDRRFFCYSAEKYLINHLERGFKTLDFYNEVKR